MRNVDIDVAFSYRGLPFEITATDERQSVVAWDMADRTIASVGSDAFSQ
jgi:hypothetical protein